MEFSGDRVTHETQYFAGLPLATLNVTDFEDSPRATGCS
jgi:hypothetical protein